MAAIPTMKKPQSNLDNLNFPCKKKKKKISKKRQNMKVICIFVNGVVALKAFQTLKLVYSGVLKQGFFEDMDSLKLS